MMQLFIKHLSTFKLILLNVVVFKNPALHTRSPLATWKQTLGVICPPRRQSFSRPYPMPNSSHNGTLAMAVFNGMPRFIMCVHTQSPTWSSCRRVGRARIMTPVLWRVFSRLNIIAHVVLPQDLASEHLLFPLWPGASLLPVRPGEQFNTLATVLFSDGCSGSRMGWRGSHVSCLQRRSSASFTAKDGMG